MLSATTAVALKQNGLKWVPERGDYYLPHPASRGRLITRSDAKARRAYVWIPRLDQLIREVEERGYGIDIDARVPGEIYELVMSKWDYDSYCWAQGSGDFTTDSANREEGVAVCLIKLLLEENAKNE